MTSPTFGSLFAGIGGFDLGLERAGFQCAWQVEINPWARKVLTRHWPDVPKHEDIHEVGAHNLMRVDVICGGFPCQDLSVAGKRAGLAGQRSGLFYELMRVVRELEPKWVLFENVPGLLTSGAGRDFHAVLSEMADSGFRRAYRILDSQYVGVAQRRRRVFLVGSARATGGDPATVLLESPSLRGDSAPGQEAGQDVAFALTASVEGCDASEDGTGRGTPLVAVARAERDSKGPDSDTKPGHLIATTLLGHSLGKGRGTQVDGHGDYPVSAHGVRRLTPTECERLQAFPDGHTCLCGVQPYSTATCRCPDTPRYAGLGNAVTVSVIEWIAHRLMAELRRSELEATA